MATNNSIGFQELTDFVSNDAAVLLDTSVMINYLNVNNEPKNIEEKIEVIQERGDFYRFLMRKIPKLKNWYVTPQIIDELNGSKSYNYKRIIKETTSYCHRYEIELDIDKRPNLEFKREIKKERKDRRRLIDAFEKEGKVLFLSSSEKDTKESLESSYHLLKHGLAKDISECDWNFLISGVAVAKANNKEVSLISNDYGIMPFWRSILSQEGFTTREIKFFIRPGFLQFELII